MAAADCPEEQSSYSLKKFVDKSPEFKELESIGTSSHYCKRHILCCAS
jgi:hypothetical protein